MTITALNLDNYQSFLASKSVRASHRGLKSIPELAAHLFPFQRHCVEFALRAGASACFLSTGLGKTEVQLEWRGKRSAEEMVPEKTTTIRFDIYMAGDLAQAKQVCREYCFEVGMCVHVEPVDFIYTGGEETGFCFRR